MTVVDVNDFDQEKRCAYKGEDYSVRNNGAVLRHQREGKRVRVNDNQWTFGTETPSNPYLFISNIRVHRIVAIAFHGEPPDANYVVDHIDSNCKNNRPENLRWLTRLENALNNSATRRKIEYLCGSIEAFLRNPSMLSDLRGNPNFKWMRAVTPEEAQNCMMRMSLLGDTDKELAKSTEAIDRKSSFSERVYKPLQKWEVGLDREPGLEMALTRWCAQYMWGALAYFPCCPQEFGTNPLDDYFQNLKAGAVLAYSEDDNLPRKLTVLESAILKSRSSILVMVERADSKWSIVGIELHGRSRHFIHFILGSYSSIVRAEEEFCAKKELKEFWSAGYGHNWVPAP